MKRTEKGGHFITEREPPSLKRADACEGPRERHLSEAGVMLAVAEWMFDLRAIEVFIYPDGMHVKEFSIQKWLTNNGFTKTVAQGKTVHAGTFVRNDQTMHVQFRPGCGDIVAVIGGVHTLVEAKGGCINTRHSGQLSKLRKHLYEAVGMLLDNRNDADRLIAAVPRHTETEKIAGRMGPRCTSAGIEIALVAGDGTIQIANSKE